MDGTHQLDGDTQELPATRDHAATGPEPDGAAAAGTNATGAGDAATAKATAEALLAEPPGARDVSAELAAPPRRKLPAITVTLSAGVLLAGGFIAGVKVEQQRSDDTGNAAAGTGGLPAGAGANGAAAGRPGGTQGGTGQFPGQGQAQGQALGQGQGQGQAAASGVTTGTIKVVDGKFIYVSDSSGNIVKVQTDDTTTINVSETGKPTDLHPGDTVVVRGTTGADGSVTATTVTEGQGTGAATAASGGAGARG